MVGWVANSGVTHTLSYLILCCEQTGRLSRIPKPRPKPKVSTPEPKLDSDLGSEKPVEDKKVDKEGSSKASESSKEEEVLRSGNEEEEHDEL